ncbi:hypothetical protein EMIHUDRAFT_198143 [Emiliania huxleyi CCMP1516]|uniref:Uncharacterized protein n=2 Tax=Emiliania huxleyi TaxID=2903 RepID=A0A0D3IEB9_EMIH1|nr:hypothetical protein EMIHUDRAFT_198143 [Emiliania huxleyi CCMP1516]EOD09604.1 hypothetical protein EMIHUDRAFT_198143 [Emiliania huxleyi CCMP1516]|eukprot:XP_005762033.1 hypothetical protein EMIHUDRAFT_198143 [Emiliania huxleyi CCMP1516]
MAHERSWMAEGLERVSAAAASESGSGAESTGIGLHSVLQGAKAGGGRAWLTAQPGVGAERATTTFHFALPVALVPRPTSRRASLGEATPDASEMESIPSSAAVRRAGASAGPQPRRVSADFSDAYLLTVFRRLGAHPASRALGAGSDERCSIAELSESVRLRGVRPFAAIDPDGSWRANRFVELALGEGAAGGRMADVVVLDNNSEERELLEEGNVDLVISKDGVATLEHRLREAGQSPY